jgi:hypothetical protein
MPGLKLPAEANAAAAQKNIAQPSKAAVTDGGHTIPSGEQPHEVGMRGAARTVGPVHRRGPDLDQHIMGCNGRLGHLSDPNHLGWAVLRLDPGLHISHRSDDAFSTGGRAVRGPATSVDGQTLTLADWADRGPAATRPAVTGEGLKPLTTR